jgi:5'-methylthioadenosine phosphorylase
VSDQPVAEVAVIGGSGLYRLVDEPAVVEVTTPFGPPSDAISLGTLGSRTVAFLPRHGRTHSLPPHTVPYRANLWALKSLGVSQILAVSAVGGLDPRLSPGSFVVPDQLIDRTTGRKQTFYDEGAVHVSFADPYCPAGRDCLVEAAKANNIPIANGGTMVVIDGPRFSTRAESRWLTAAGGTLVNMTGHPEAVLARELALCYSAIALVTDTDAGVVAGAGVTQAEVFRMFAERAAMLKPLLARATTGLPRTRHCDCVRALDGLQLPAGSPVNGDHPPENHP